MFSPIVFDVYIQNQINIPFQKTELKKHDTINIFYNNNSIKFSDTATVNKILNTDIIIVKNSFGRLIKCRLISNEIAEVIQ